MNATQCGRAARAQTSSGRYRKAAFVSLAAAAIVCGPAAGQQDPAIFGEWNDPHNTGSDWEVSAMHAAHLPTGSILVWKNPTLEPEPFLWDPVLDTLTEMPTDFLINCSGHVGLPDGTILFAGGGPSTRETKIFSFEGLPGGPWLQVADMAFARFYPTCTTLPDGRVVATSGRDEFSQTVLTPEIFNAGIDPLDGTWEEVSILTVGIARRYPHMFVVPDANPDVQKVFFSSSSVPDQFDTDTYMLDIGPPATWTAVGGDPLFHTMRGSAVMYQPGKVLKCGGDEFEFGAGTLADTATINLNDLIPLWQSEQSMMFARQEHNLVLLPDGKILAVGGEDNGAVTVAEWFDPNDPFQPQWVNLAAMSIGRAHHSTAVLLADGRVLSAGGEDGFGDPDGTAQIFSPPYLFWGQPPVIGFAPRLITYGTNFRVEVLAVGGDPIARVTLLRLGATTHNFDHNQRFMELAFTEPVPGRLQVVPPAKANEMPPGSHMLFVLSANGVPSVAKYVRLTLPPSP